jgi:hypothetical protein
MIEAHLAFAELRMPCRLHHADGVLWEIIVHACRKRAKIERNPTLLRNDESDKADCTVLICVPVEIICNALQVFARLFYTRSTRAIVRLYNC